MIKGVIFDMDGLMIDTESLLQRFWCEASHFYGYPMKPEHPVMIRSLSGPLAATKLKELVCEDFDYTKVRTKRIELMNDYIQKNGLEKKKGLDELLAYLHEHHYKCAIATATSYDRTEIYLTKLNLLHSFDIIVCPPMIKKGKPDPEIYLTAADKLQLPPSQCIALEDSPNGITSAFHAGCKPVMVPDLAPPDEATKSMLYACVDNLAEVIPLLEQAK